MSENLQKYAVSVDFDAAISKINKLKVASKSLNRIQENSLMLQIYLQKRLNALKGAGITGKTAYVPSSPTAPVTKPITKSDPKAAFVGPMPQKAAIKQYKQEQNINAALEKRRNDVMHILALEKRVASEKKKQHIEEVERNILSARNKVQINQILRTHRFNTRELSKQNFLMQKIGSSSKQFAGNMFSAFALAAGAKSIVDIGQDLQSVDNTMLAVSSNAKESGENLKFVKDEAYRLGLGLKESSKGFAKMVSAKGDMSLDDVKASFTGLSEMSTLLGLSSEESGRAINALQQMMSKGTVTAEELKQQMGEVLPNSLQLMAKAAQDAGLSTSGTVDEMYKLQQGGKLISSKVLPHFAKRLHEAATANGGLENALKSNRVAMGQMKFAYTEAADAVFKNGFEEGLTKLFKSLGKMLKENMPLWTALGRVMGVALKVLAGAVDIITLALKSFGGILEFCSDKFKYFNEVLVAFVAGGVMYKIVKGLKMIRASAIGALIPTSALTLRFLLVAAAIAAAVAVIQDLWLYFTDDKAITVTGLLIKNFTKYIDDLTKSVKEAHQWLKDLFSFGGKSLDVNVNKSNAGYSGLTQRPAYQGMYSYTKADFNKQNQPITLQVDGETLGRVVSKTTAFDESVNNKFTEVNTSNY